MKNIFLIIGVCSICFLGCRDDKNEGKTVDATEDIGDSSDVFESKSCIPEETVRQMVDRWYSLPKTNDNTIQQITLAGNKLRKFIKKDDMLKMYMASYLLSGNGHKENETTVIVSRIRGDKKIFCDINDIFKPDVNSRGPGTQQPPPLCPPPSNCDFPLAEQVKTTGLVKDSTRN